MMPLTLTFLVIRLLQQALESTLSYINFRYAMEPARGAAAASILSISPADLDKTRAYTRDKYFFHQTSTWLSTILTLIFLALGGLGWLEGIAQNFSNSWQLSEMATGLCFFAGLGLISYLSQLPFDLYYTFIIEQKHGFNRQTRQGFWLDQVKGIVVGTLLGGALLAALLWIMFKTADNWWWAAWLLFFIFNLLTAWLYPSLLAPLFNKFTPLEAGPLREAIFKLATKVNFNTDGISVMDASKRSSHGNAYFTGVFGKKRIVLFDTLLKSMNKEEIVAVLAHELGHFKLHHVRWSLIRGFFMTGLIFWLLSLCLPLQDFYLAFGLRDVSSYGALIVFSLWFSPIAFLLRPMGSFISRRNEFAADRFALEHAEDPKDLGRALLKLRETSHLMPLSHPLYSAVYHSHPPLLERLQAMRYIH